MAEFRKDVCACGYSWAECDRLNSGNVRLGDGICVWPVELLQRRNQDCERGTLCTADENQGR